MYDPTEKTLSKSGGLSIAEVAQCLASSSGDLGTLCVFPAINPLAKYKPVDLALYTELTDAQRKTVNYGTGVPELINDEKKPLDGDEWYHVKPTTVGRLLDFDGYAHRATPGVGIGWNSGSAGSVSPIDWANSESAAVVFFMIHDAIGFVPGSMEMSDLKLGSLDLTQLYFWVAVMAGNNVYLKRSDRSIGAIMSESQSSRLEVLMLYIRTTSTHDADFNGELRSISSDFTMQAFVGSDSPYGQQLTDVRDIPYKYSLNCRNHMDVQNFGNIVAPWDKLLTASITTIPLLVLLNTGAYRHYEFQAAGAATFVRGTIEEQSVQAFVYKVTGHFMTGQSGQGGFVGAEIVVEKDFVLDNAMSVPSGGSSVQPLGLMYQGVFAPIGETNIVTIRVRGARTAASTFKDLCNGSYVIFPDNTVMYPDGRRHNPDGTLY